MFSNNKFLDAKGCVEMAVFYSENACIGRVVNDINASANVDNANLIFPASKADTAGFIHFTLLQSE